jgi:hypothetical protein
MVTQEQKFKNQYSDLIAAFEAAFPGVTPPESRWFFLWLAKYPVCAIKDVIHILQQHPLKAQFTTESTGRAISALLRAEALKRAVASAPISGRAR